ncbi:YlqD family protein [Aneurinibacillus aneurinilyticus]|nr:YlqD family protein [Aneurinibacillus aneurinilyticus]MED0707461.1 YlqD family protein [Aneurinibacillus aneurinilyticus]MED0724731.1 YlqD family protein [Aneurinibacillus aneurinilyticus]MED0733181.1 YlqD family protein [Aneurinibacillus aneurinilyticus]MED0742842.1 YlqD family protein [Aneurinibacillus aneurinilyticus]
MLKIKRKINVMMILTESSRKEMKEEFGAMHKRYELELEQLNFQAKKLLQEAQRKGREALDVVQRRLAQERQAREEKISRISFQLEQLANLPLGSELHYTTVESEVEVSVGDNWGKVMEGTEIVLLDGIIKEIREGRTKA